MKKIYFLIAVLFLLNEYYLFSQDNQLIWKKTIYHIGVSNTAIFSPDENIVINGAGKYVQSRDISGEVINNFDGGDAIISVLAYSPDGEFIYSGAEDENNPDFEPIVIQWDVKTGELNNVFEIPNAIDFDMVESIDVSPDNKYLVAVFRSKSKDNQYRTIALWDNATTSLIKTSKQNDARVHTNIKFSSDSKSLIINIGKTIEKHSAPSLELITEFGNTEQQHSDYVRDFDFSNDGDKIATVGFDGYIKLWDYKTGNLISSYKPSSSKKEFFKVKLVDDDKSVFVAEKESPNLELYSLKYKRKFTSYKSYLSDIKDFTVTNDFQKILIADSSSIILLKSDYYSVNSVADNQIVGLSLLPNPIDSRGVLNYSINSNGFISLKLFNYQGILVRKILNKYESAGNYQISFESKNLNSGIYYLILKTNNTNKIIPIIVIPGK